VGRGVVGPALAAAVLVAVALAGPIAPAARGGQAPVPAPDFHLPLLSGGPPGGSISLAFFKGRPLVLLFWAPW
jgi:hypothetical protein